MKPYILTLILAVFSLSPAFSQVKSDSNKQGYIVKGQVRDSISNETIPYVTIKITSKSHPDKLFKILASDQDGKYQVNIENKDSYLFSYEYIGQKNRTVLIELSDDKIIDMGIIRMSEEKQELSEVVVSAVKPLVKLDLDKIIYHMENDPESQTSNTLDMLRKVPLLTIDGDETIRLKGSSNYVIYLNGKRSNMVMSNPKDVLRSMPANTIKSVEVITDPGVKYDAEGVSGIINIVTKRNSLLTGFTTTLNSSVNSLGGFGSGAFFQLKYGKVGFIGGYNYNLNKTPRGESSSYTEDFTSESNKYLNQEGVSKTKRYGQSVSAEISYEIDTLNLLYFGINRYVGRIKTNTDQTTEMLDVNHLLQYGYDYDSFSKQKNEGMTLA